VAVHPGGQAWLPRPSLVVARPGCQPSPQLAYGASRPVQTPRRPPSWRAALSRLPTLRSCQRRNGEGEGGLPLGMSNNA
jgi:hypothetical protein